MIVKRIVSQEDSCYEYVCNVNGKAGNLLEGVILDAWLFLVYSQRDEMTNEDIMLFKRKINDFEFHFSMDKPGTLRFNKLIIKLINGNWVRIEDVMGRVYIQEINHIDFDEWEMMI